MQDSGTYVLELPIQHTLVLRLRGRQILRPAGQLRSLTHLSVKDGFEANPNGKRGFRVGIDASIWFYHAAYGKEGENPELRTLFFRCARLMEMPFLPVFVFDGPKRPDMKRGKRITGKNHWLVQGMQEIITAFGFEWRMVSGSALSTCSSLNVCWGRLPEKQKQNSHT